MEPDWNPGSKWGEIDVDRTTRNAIERATQAARRLLEKDFAGQLEGTFDILPSGEISSQNGVHLSPRQRLARGKIVAAIEHKLSLGMTAKDAVADYLRDAAFTALNRFAALKMLEARELVQECITRGEQSAGFKEFFGLAPGIALLPDGAGYRLYIECLFDELSTEIKVLFDRRDPASILWPKRQTFEELLSVLNAPDLAAVWGEDETIGWVYQFFNSGDERKKMRDESAAPRNSRELAVRNQFFTPRYVVQFLADNTLGRMWYEMRQGQTRIGDQCEYMVRRPGEILPSRAPKDPRDLRILDPACGSGHFLLYTFDLLVTIYEEGWSGDGPRSEATGRTLKEDYSDLNALRRELPRLILGHNLHGVDIDPRCAQIAQLALWMRAQNSFKQFGIARDRRPSIERTHIVVAEPMPGQEDLVKAFAATMDPPLIGELFQKIVAETALAGELGVLLRLEQSLSVAVEKAREAFKALQNQGQQVFMPGLEPVKPQVELDLSGIDDESFFAEVEERILKALERFSESATGRAGMRRRLFAGDSAQGLALLELCRKRFDVILMNPPFGAVTSGAKKEFEKAFPKTKNDIYAAFVERGIDVLCSKGRIGAITSRTGFFLSSFEKWREDVLLKKAPPVVFADLGMGVLDSAMVETAAYCLETVA